MPGRLPKGHSEFPGPLARNHFPSVTTATKQRSLNLLSDCISVLVLVFLKNKTSHSSFLYIPVIRLPCVRRKPCEGLVKSLEPTSWQLGNHLRRTDSTMSCAASNCPK